jgi:DNA-binding transcriptional MerR regulator
MAKKIPGFASDIETKPIEWMKIGQLRENVFSLTGERCTSAMIYNYEKHGLIQPSARTTGGLRLYTQEDLKTVACIKTWQAEGLSLHQIKEKINRGETQTIFKDFNPDLPIDRCGLILSASKKLFPQNGYEETTLQNIANEAGVPVSAIYQCFDSKEDIFLTIVKNMHFGQLLREIKDLLPLKKSICYEEVRQTLIHLSTYFLQDHLINADFMRLLLRMSYTFPELSHRYVKEFIIPMQDILEEYFRFLIQKELFREVNTSLAVRVFFGIWADITFLRDVMKAGEFLSLPEKKDVGPIIDMFLGGMLKNSS